MACDGGVSYDGRSAKENESNIRVLSNFQYCFVVSNMLYL